MSEDEQGFAIVDSSGETADASAAAEVVAGASGGDASAAGLEAANAGAKAAATVIGADTAATEVEAAAAGVHPAGVRPAGVKVAAAPMKAMPIPTPGTPASGSLLELMQPFVNFEEIAIEEKVGHGSYGVVYKALWRDRFVAVKEFEANSDQKAIETEVKQLSRVAHSNIITLYGISANHQSKYLIMEYAEGGSLHNFLHGKVKPYYATAHGISWARQCAEGVAYLHAMKPKPLIHRDLKPLNLLLTNKGRHLKICDFGTVADKSTLMTNNKGSAAWMAPEVFEGSKYTEKCDVFSWAIVLWEVLSRQRPFKETDNNYAIMWKIHKGERPPLIENCPDIIVELMTSCWAKVPDLRPSMRHVVDVMNELASSFPGAEAPLQYEFKNQQIVRLDNCLDTNDNYTLNFNSFKTINNSGASASHLTPTNVGGHSNTSSDTTPTNTATASNPSSNVPAALISASTRWDVITEETDPGIFNIVDTNTTDPFNLRPSAESAERYNAIEQGVRKMAGVLMAPLAVQVDANAWDLPRDESNSFFAKSDGKERLTVTDTKVLMSDNNNSSNNRGLVLPNVDSTTTTPSDDDDDEEIDGTVMLDPEFQPEPPIANNAESQQIYREHQRLAKEYLLLDTKLSYAQVFKENLLEEISPVERQEKQELLKKMSEKEELLDLYNNLKQQLETMRAQQPISSNTAAAATNTTSTGALQHELVSDDGWVVIAPQQNT